MTKWKSSLLWAGLPILMLLAVFGIISAINWGYESKLFTSDITDSESNNVYLGTLLLAMATGMTLLASVVLLVVRLIVPNSRASWVMFVALLAVTIVLVFPSLFIVILGPASITMIQQTRTAPTR